MTAAALEWIARFRRYMSSERRLSAHTDSSYARDLAALVKFCDRSGLSDWSALDSQHVRTFAAHSHAAGLACCAKAAMAARARARRRPLAGGRAASGSRAIPPTT
ncbi:MAG: hypothetical protein E6H56_01045 [Betaproteobacteria bacterium]|nr:MAG: hypothetical protein E6H56_01045 [Betaproteobacteria bacterium]